MAKDIGIMSKLRTAYEKLGRSNGAKLPYDDIDRKGMSNKDASDAVEKHNACLDYARASLIQSAAKKEKEAAQARMVVLGVLGDFDHLRGGLTHLTYDSRELYVNVQCNNDSIGDVDKVALDNALKKELKPDVYLKVAALVAQNTKTKRGARTVNVMIKETLT